jgi:DNA-binding HxlR family transcriptional regulator
LTPLGKSLLPVVLAMTRWGQKQLEEKVKIQAEPEAPKNQQLPLF